MVEASSNQVRRRWRRGLKMELAMLDRQMIGDVAIAFLLAVPTVAMSRPQPPVADKPDISSPMVEKAAFADRTSVEKRADLPAVTD